jgi:2-octaprenylphenol hydroxylase
MTDFDVLIVGGGMVGASLACALGGSTLRVGLIETAPPSPPDLREFDLRVSAITLASRALFEHVGVWDEIASKRVSPISAMRVWDADGDGRLDFDSSDLGEPYLGYIIENSVMTTALWERARTHANVRLICPATIADVGFTEDQVAARLDNGRAVTARLLVGADGTQSRVRQLAGIGLRGWDYQQHAIVATVSTAQSHTQVAWQRFLPTGPLALLPLPDPHRCSIVWSCAQEQAQTLMALEPDAFAAALQAAFGDALGSIALVSERRAFPLGLAHAQRYVQPRLALIGDAAHRVHPLAGQGVNLGFADSAALAEVILDAFARGRDPGGLTALRRYERWRKGDNLAMLALTDALNRLFRAKTPMLRRLGDAGLRVVNAAGPAKHWLMTQAVGLRADLPRLMRRRCA